MTRRTLMATLGALTAVALLATGCRGGADGEPEPEGLRTDAGVTTAPCPEPVNPGNGCIYLGVVSDLSDGPFAPLGLPYTEAQRAFWERVNEAGGLGGFDVDVTTHVADSRYTPELHLAGFEEIQAHVLALAQSLGGPPTEAILPELRAREMLMAPTTWSSAWAFEPEVLQVGTNYCMEAANAVDWFAAGREDPLSVMAVHYPGDYGEDGAHGAAAAAAFHDADFVAVSTPPGEERQGPAVAEIVAADPDLVFLTTGPAEAGELVGQSRARGYGGVFVGSSPTWNKALLQTPSAPALEAAYFHAAPWGPWDTATVGHAAVRAAFGDVTPNDAYIAGWVWQYPLKAVIEHALAEGDLTRSALRRAAAALTEVDFEGILPPGAGDFAHAAGVFRQSVIAEVDPTAPTGLRTVQDLFAGPTAHAMDLTAPCFQQNPQQNP